MLIRFALVVLTLLALAQWVPGIVVANLYVAVIVAVLFGVASVTIKPLLTLLTLPIHFITFGLSSFLISALIFWFLSTFVEGFVVAGFIPALLGALAISVAVMIASAFD